MKKYLELICLVKQQVLSNVRAKMYENLRSRRGAIEPAFRITLAGGKPSKPST